MKYRLLSFCMAVLLLISMISVPRIEAANSTETFKDSADTKIVKLLEALGLMEIDSETGFFWDEMPVKRSELAKIICKMFNISETKDASPHFTDVSDYDRAYIETAIRNGYMSGYDNEKFGPDDYVTNIQLIKTFVTALGGDAAAQSQGGYPGGYITIGNMLGLLKGKAVANENISRRIDVANIIYTALHADVLEIAGDACALDPAVLDLGSAVGGQIQLISCVQGLQQFLGAGHEEVALGQLFLIKLADLLRSSTDQLPLFQQLPLSAVQDVITVQNGVRGVYMKVPQGLGERLPLRPVEVQNGVVQVQKDESHLHPSWGFFDATSLPDQAVFCKDHFLAGMGLADPQKFDILLKKGGIRYESL